MEKIIFLDFDGVLNTEYYQNLLYLEGKALQDEYGSYFDPEAVKQLKRIVDATRADIVVESSWKYLGFEAMREMWEEREMPGSVINITPTVDNNKGMEIASWLSANTTEGTKYVIIDDEYVILDPQQPHFILTNPYDGITEELADRAISILNN